MKKLRDEKGMVLLLVLAVVALLTSLMVEFAFSTLVDLRLTETFRDRTRAWYLAKGGIEAGRQILKYGKTIQTGFNHPSELWGTGVPSYPVGENGAVSITIEDLSGRLPINTLDTAGGNPDLQQALERLFSELERSHPDVFPDPPSDMVAALIDWIDDDDVVSRQPGTGAEDNYYLRLENPYATKDDPLDTMDELQLVKGFSAETVRLLEPYLTVYRSASININTAPPEVLLAMHADVDQQATEQIMNYRSTQAFKTIADLGQALNPQSTAYSGLRGMQWLRADVKSDFFRITAEGAVGDGRRTATAVVSADGQKIHYLKVD